MSQMNPELVEEVIGNTLTFIAPSGYSYTIREQNGNDDDILSNPAEAESLMNLIKFVMAIVVNTDYTPNGKLTLDQALDMPSLDRYCIILKSRIFSIGRELEFSHNWGEKLGTVNYSQDLEEFVFDYSKEPTPEILAAKKEAIPYYPMGKVTKDIEVITPSNKRVKFDVLTPRGESYIMELPLDRRTKNAELIARNLRLEVNGKMEKVTNFSIFSVADMRAIRKEVNMVDPIFMGNTEITHPSNPDLIRTISIMGIPDFFFPEEI